MVDTNNADVDVDDKINNSRKDNNNNLNNIVNTNTGDFTKIKINDQKESDSKEEKQDGAIINSTDPINNNEATNNQTKEIKFEKKFFNFAFYRVDPKWRWLNEIGKDESSIEFLELLRAANAKMKVRTYSTIGLRHDCEFMILTISPSLENIQVFTSKIYLTILGKYIQPVNTFLSLTRKSIYSSQVKLGFERDDDVLKYLVVYPFTKSREWYLLPLETRKQMMDEHIKVGRKYPDIRLNTTYSFGIGDQDFMLAFETEDLSNFQDLIMELRETQVSRYILNDLPMIPCVSKKMDEIIKSLG
jgi:chlorite dismutase